jgi:hypothetical protein
LGFYIVNPFALDILSNKSTNKLIVRNSSFDTVKYNQKPINVNKKVVIYAEFTDTTKSEESEDFKNEEFKIPQDKLNDLSSLNANNRLEKCFYDSFIINKSVSFWLSK